MSVSFYTRLGFFCRMLLQRARNQARTCPYCSSRNLYLIGRKKVVMDVLQCAECHLIFRYPLDDIRASWRYYQKSYKSGFVTGIPEAVLDSYLEKNFAGSPLDVSSKINVLRAVCPQGRVIDYGCSWGYTVWQLQKAGYEAVGFEISKPRAEFGRRRLGVPILDDFRALRSPELRGAFDVIFTNHVVEHLTDIRNTFDLFAELLRPGGCVFHILPNFEGRTARTGAFWHWIGRDHPIAPTAEFFRRALPRHGMGKIVVGSGPFDEQLAFLVGNSMWDRLPQDGDELLVIAWKEG